VPEETAPRHRGRVRIGGGPQPGRGSQRPESVPAPDGVHLDEQQALETLGCDPLPRAAPGWGSGSCEHERHGNQR
jgi:hypothetical protein